VPLRGRRRLLLGLVFPLILALTAYVVLHYTRVVYAVFWPGLANGTTITLSGIDYASWGYYMGFGRMTLSVSPPDEAFVYVKTLNFYTFASAFNLSAIGTPVDTGFGIYYPCGHYGLIVYSGVVIPVEVSTYQGLYVYMPTDALQIPLQCYSQWPVDSKPILTFDGTSHICIWDTVYAKAYTYDPSQGLVPTLYNLYSLSGAQLWWSPKIIYGSHGITNVDGVWFLQMVAVYVTNIYTDVTLTATAAD